MQLVVVVQQRFAKHRLCRRTGVHKSRSGDERGISRGNSQPGGPGLSAEFPRRTHAGNWVAEDEPSRNFSVNNGKDNTGSKRKPTSLKKSPS